MTTRGPFHLVSVDYRHREHQMITCDDEDDLRATIIQETCEGRAASFRQRLEAATIDELLTFLVAHGETEAREQTGWGCIAVVEGGRCVSDEHESDIPVRPSLAEELELSAVEEGLADSSPSQVTKTTLTDEEKEALTVINAKMDRVELALRQREADFDFPTYRDDFNKAQELPLPPEMNKRLHNLLYQITEHLLPESEITEMNIDYEHYKEDARLMLIAGEKTWRIRNLLEGILKRRPPLVLRFKIEALRDSLDVEA